MAASAASLRSNPRPSATRPATYASSSANAALHPRAEDRDVVAEGACEPRHRVEVEQRGDDDALAALRGRDDRPGSVRRRHRKSPGARLEVLAGRVAEVEPVDADAETLPPRVTSPLLEGTCLLDLRGAPDPPVPGVERLADRRGRADDVDDDPRRGLRRLVGRERDVNPHAGTLAARWPTHRIATGIRTARRSSRAPNAAARSARTA